MSDVIELVVKLKNSLHKVISGFSLRCGDHLTAITDYGVEEPVRAALFSVMGDINAISSKTGVTAELVLSKQPTGSAQSFEPEVEARMEPATALLYLTSLSRSHCEQTHKFVMSDRPGRQRARLISITNGRADTLLEGAINEDLDVMRARIKRINSLTQDVVSYHITSPEGTDIIVNPWRECMVVDDGLLDAPGKLGNFPFGEGSSTAVKFFGTNGYVVSNRVAGNGLGRLSEPINLEILNGKIVHIDGGEQAERLVAAMNEADRKISNKCHLPHPSRWIAEFAFGANAAAWRVKDGKKVLPPTSLEAEKAYEPEDTSIHIANGANHVFNVPPYDLHYNEVGHHTDHVLQGMISVKATKADGTSFYMIDRGRPIY